LIKNKTEGEADITAAKQLNPNVDKAQSHLTALLSDAAKSTAKPKS
jgi:hypothetical protein